MQLLRNICVIALFAAPFSHAGKWVTMYTDDTYTQKIKRQKLDCKIHRNKKNTLTLGFKISIPFVKIGPEIEIGSSMTMRWNQMSQECIRRFEEMCDEHNKGNLTVSEFNSRRKDLDEYYERILRLKIEIGDLVEKHANLAFEELDKEEAKRNQDEIGEKAMRLHTEVSSIAKEFEDMPNLKKVDKEKK
ncbi:MAG: hypothetical protein O3B01_04165 [Planctomycetota bacterium]|nr:hypothetical protein [Planctomycetota bacterium]MDA1137756.1 hypothetical protein [Planctomycetota bacterium]